MVVLLESLYILLKDHIRSRPFLKITVYTHLNENLNEIKNKIYQPQFILGGKDVIVSPFEKKRFFSLRKPLPTFFFLNSPTFTFSV